MNKKLILALALVALTALSAMATTTVVVTNTNQDLMVAVTMTADCNGTLQLTFQNSDNPAQYVLAGNNEAVLTNKVATAITNANYTDQATAISNVATTNPNTCTAVNVAKNEATTNGIGNKETAYNVIKYQTLNAMTTATGYTWRHLHLVRKG